MTTTRGFFCFFMLCAFLAGSAFAPTTAYAAGCEDVESAAQQAAKDRNEQAKKALDATMPAAEDSRSAIASCLDTLAALGDPFSMGVSIPSMDQILEQMCNQVDSYIDQKISQGMAEVETSISGALGNNNPFEVSLNPSDISKPLTGGLK